jgi:hypothetical protein
VFAEEAERADLDELADFGRLIAAVSDAGLKRLERLHLRKWVLSVLGLGKVDKADAVIELEGRVAESGGLGGPQLARGSMS